MHSGDHFSPDYVTARARFREAVGQTGGRLTPLALSARGPRDETLTIDVAWFGAETPTRVFLHSSGVHGVEAFAGSAVQLQWLADPIPEMREDAVLVLVHVINPYGMAWLRRFNEHSVDLNRNFLAPDETYDGAPVGYAQLDTLLNPPSPPSRGLFYLQASWLIARHGLPWLRQAVAGGQYINPKGLFFGGASMEEGPRVLQEHLQSRLAGVSHLVVVDLHTGLGPFGVDTLLALADNEGDPRFRTLQETYGDRVSSMDPDRGPAYRVKGSYDAMYPRVLPGAEVHVVGQEFGTYRAVTVVKALRAENRWHHYGDRRVDHQTKRDLKEAFCPEDTSWREEVLRRGRIVIGQALGLLDRRD